MAMATAIRVVMATTMVIKVAMAIRAVMATAMATRENRQIYLLKRKCLLLPHQEGTYLSLLATN